MAVTDIVSQVTAKLKGESAGQMDKDGELRDITIHLPKIGVSVLGDMIIKNGTSVIRLYEVAKIEESVAPTEIYRRNQSRIGKVMAELDKE